MSHCEWAKPAKQSGRLEVDRRIATRAAPARYDW
jgi:hypothetical protein